MKKFITLTAAAFALSCGSGSDTAKIDLIPIANGGNFGFADKEGKIVINPQFSAATLFRDGISLVRTGGSDAKYGFIDRDGKYVINPAYRQATIFSEGIAFVVSDNSAPQAIDKSGKSLFTLQQAEDVSIFKDGLASFSVIGDDGSKKWGFVDKDGKIVIQPQFSLVDMFSEGRCAVANDSGKWGYIDKSGKIVINPQFDQAGKFSGGTAIVNLSGKFGTIDDSGKYIVNPQFDGMYADGKMFMVNSGGRIGWADKSGKMKINPQFDDAYPFLGNDIAPVRSGGSWGYIDQDGKFRVNPQFEHASPFNGSVALVRSGSKTGMIDKKGNYVVNPQFDGVSADYFQYFLGRETATVVQTDYVNIGQIADRLRKDITATTFAGIDFSTRTLEVMEKFGKSASSYNMYSNDFYLVRNEQIGKAATLSFQMYQVPIVTRGYFNREIDPEGIPGGYAYNISLSGKAYGKGKEVFDALDGVFAGFTKSGNEYRKQYVSSGYNAEATLSGSYIQIVITPQRSENLATNY